MGLTHELGRLGERVWLLRLGVATLVANIGIVVTGGAVRLTGSGLGCPTWPRCTDESFVPHGEMGIHGVIEFGNRLLTFVLVAVAVATFVTAWQSRRRDLRVMALVLALGVPGQAIVGGITVLTDLNPWIVSLHLLLSLAMISLAVLYLWRIDRPGTASAPTPRGLTALAWTTYVVSWVTLYVGTVVTGAGPHAGDLRSPRNGLDPRALAQLHADAVFLYLGLALGLLLGLVAVGAGAAQLRAARALLVVLLAQGAIGFVQYFTDLPELLVGLHLLGAALISAVVTWTLLAVREGGRPRPERPGRPEDVAS